MILAIFGPTGVGKTGVAVSLAELLRERDEDPVAINCDALQVYEGIDLLTGTASEAEHLNDFEKTRGRAHHPPTTDTTLSLRF